MEDRSSSKGWRCTLPAAPTADSGSIIDSVGFDLIGSDLGKDVESALQVALAGGAVLLALGLDLIAGDGDQPEEGVYFHLIHGG